MSPKIERIFKAAFFSLFMWPWEAACFMWGCHILHHAGFAFLPTFSYWGSFWPVFGLQLLVTSATASGAAFRESER